MSSGDCSPYPMPTSSKAQPEFLPDRSDSVQTSSTMCLMRKSLLRANRE